MFEPGDVVLVNEPQHSYEALPPNTRATVVEPQIGEEIPGCLWVTMDDDSIGGGVTLKGVSTLAIVEECYCTLELKRGWASE